MRELSQSEISAAGGNELVCVPFGLVFSAVLLYSVVASGYGFFTKQACFIPFAGFAVGLMMCDYKFRNGV